MFLSGDGPGILETWPKQLFYFSPCLRILVTVFWQAFKMVLTIMDYDVIKPS